ncbi:MAG: TIGR04211 family SH3 domain-containing protein [Halieaceae bacterium]
MHKHFFAPLLGLLLASLPLATLAQEIRYISDTQYIPVRSGQGSQYRIVHRGIPSGTRVTVSESNAETGYSQITTDRGTSGWVRSQYLMSEVPAKIRLSELEARNEALMGDENSLRSQLVDMQNGNAELRAQLQETTGKLKKVSSELTEVRRISSNALSLDSSNRRLAEETEVMRTRLEVLEADNRRLKDSEENQAFFNGVLAVLLGVIIALLVPRLRPKPRSSSSWA